VRAVRDFGIGLMELWLQTANLAVILLIVWLNHVWVKLKEKQFKFGFSRDVGLFM
jgi:hypothetical protein